MKVNAFYVLLDLASGNVIGEYDEEHEALADLRRTADSCGIRAISEYSLLRLEDGRQSLVAMQGLLVRMATNSVFLSTPQISRIITPGFESIAGKFTTGAAATLELTGGAIQNFAGQWLYARRQKGMQNVGSATEAISEATA